MKGSHRQYVHPEKRGRMTIPFHSKVLNPITIKSILRQAGLTDSAEVKDKRGQT